MSKSGSRPVRRGHRPVVAFLLKCFLFWGVALLLVSRFSFIEEWGVNLTVHTLQLAFGLLGQGVARQGSSIQALGSSVQIVSDCSPHMPFLIYGAVILAFPSSWRQRLLGLLFGALVIHLFNTIRIITLIWILKWRTSWFEFAHVYLWQTGTILIVFITFALWIRTLGSRPKTA